MLDGEGVPGIFAALEPPPNLERPAGSCLNTAEMALDGRMEPSGFVGSNDPSEVLTSDIGGGIDDDRSSEWPPRLVIHFDVRVSVHDRQDRAVGALDLLTSSGERVTPPSNAR